MHSKTRMWLPTIVVLFIVSFLIAYQPLRPLAKQTAPEASFEYRLPESIAKDEKEYATKQLEVRKVLVDGGINEEDLEDVTLISGQLVRIKTWALNDDQATQDEKRLLEALAKKYTGVQFAGRSQQEAVEQPLYSIGTALGVYRPTPKIKLGLDLQGGLHVVLRCLPSARMAFVTSEDEGSAEPLYLTEDAKAKAAAAKPTDAAATKSSGPTVTRAELEKRVVAELVRAQLGTEDTITAKAVSPYRLIVETRAEDERVANKQRSAVLSTLQSMYPAYKTINPPDDEFEVLAIAADTADKVKNVIDRRLFQMGEIREPVIQRQGADQIIVEIPGVRDPDRVTSILKSTALLEFRLIPQRYENAAPGGDTYDEWRDTRSGEMVGWDRVLAESKSEFRGADLLPNSTVIPGDSPGEWEVSFELRTDKQRAFHEFTRKNVNRLMAIVLDDKCQMAPVIKGPIPGKGVIEGNFSAEDAGDLRLLLNAGALPVPLEIAENRTVSATLGEDTVKRSLKAGAAAGVLVLLFMIAYYRLPGLLANIALCLYFLLTMAVLAASQSIKGIGGITVTLPGIAGIVLSIGMAVDANIIIFERLKEELWAGKTMRSAIAAGWDRAWAAILDGNVTTLITCAVLYFLGSSMIKSFASTLFIGVVLSMFTAVTISRWLVVMASETKLGRNLALWGVKQDRDA